MAPRGRKPKPSAIKKLTGNPGKRKLNAREPRPKAPSLDDLRPPRGLDRDGEYLWNLLAPQLVETGVLKNTDLPALEVMCQHYAVLREAWSTLLKEGITADGVQGGIKKHPAAAVFRENSLALRAYLTEFGLTPSSRVRLQVEPPREETLADVLFKAVQDEPNG